MDFTQSIQWAFRQENPGNNGIHCKNDRFGDIAPGRAKQCWCEAPIPRKPQPCGAEGQNCRCPAHGKVFYGAASSSKNAHATFQELTESPYAVKQANNNGVTPCKNNFFGTDPLPGVSKQCYCDGDNKYPNKEITIDLAEFAAKKQEEDAMQAQTLAEAAKKAAEEEAIKVAADAKAAADAAAAEAKAKQEAAKAAAEAARKKAEEEAKAARDAQHTAQMAA